MKIVISAIVALVLPLGAAAYAAESMNAEPNGSMTKDQKSPGTTGAMSNATSNGVATDPQGVAEQQKGSSKASPGTVGAAPGADTPSQNPHH